MRNSQISTKGHLSATATSLQKPFFLADSPYIHSFFNPSTTATSLQWPLCSVAMQGGYGYCSLTNRDSITSIFPEKLAANSSLNQPAPFEDVRNNQSIRWYIAGSLVYREKIFSCAEPARQPSRFMAPEWSNKNAWHLWLSEIAELLNKTRKKRNAIIR